MDYINDFETLSSQFSEKEIKKLQFPLLIRLINKLKDNNIEDYEINTKMTELLTCLDDIYRDYKQQRKIYNKTLRNLMNYVQKTYGLIAKAHKLACGLLLEWH